MIHIEIERDWVKIAGQVVYRPENIVPGDWISTLERVTKDDEKAYQDGYAEGISNKERELEQSYDEGFNDGYNEAMAEQ